MLVLGVAYKADIGDMRESPALKLIELLQDRGRRGRVPRPARPRAARAGLRSVALDAGRVRLRRDRHRTHVDRLRPARRGRARVVDLRNATGANGRSQRQGLEAVTRGSARPGSAPGARTSRATSTSSPISRWLCDLDRRSASASPPRDPARAHDRRLRRAARDDPSSTPWSIATPVPTHYELARRSRRQARLRREAARDARAEEMEELVALAEERGLVLMPGHLLLYHPGVQKLKELVDAGELGEVLYVYGNRQNLGVDPQERERALVARRARPLGDPPPPRRGAERGAGRTATRSSTRASRTSSSATCASRPGRSRTHAPVVARPAQDAEDHRRRARQDGRLRRHGARAQGDDLREGAVAARRRYGEWRTRTGDIFSPKIDRRAAAARVPALPRARRRRRRPARRAPHDGARRRAHARAAPELACAVPA